MTRSLNEMGLDNFEFVRDTKKVKVYVGLVPLTKNGYGKQ